MKWMIVLLLGCPLFGQELPDAPAYRVIDWSFVAVHTVHGAALAWDFRRTAIGVSNGCAEASTNLGPHPSTGRLVGVGLAEFGGVMALDIGMRLLARHQRLPRWLGIAGGSIGPGIGTFRHVQGALSWGRTECLLSR